MEGQKAAAPASWTSSCREPLAEGGSWMRLGRRVLLISGRAERAYVAIHCIDVSPNLTAVRRRGLRGCVMAGARVKRVGSGGGGVARGVGGRDVSAHSCSLLFFNHASGQDGREANLPVCCRWRTTAVAARYISSGPA